MANQKKVLSNRIGDVFFLNLPIISGIAVPAVTLPIILHNLPVEDYGAFQFVIALEVWFSIFTLSHISFGAKRGIARGLDGTLIFSFLSRLKFFTIAAFLVWIVALVLYRVEGFETMGSLLFLFGIFFLAGVLPQATWRQFFVAKKLFGQYALWRSLPLIIAPMGGMIAAIQTQDVIIFAIVQFGLSSVLSISALIYVVWKYRLIPAWRRGEIDREVMSYGKRMFLANFAASASERGTGLIVGSFFGFANLAVFSVAEKITMMFQSFLGSSYSLFYADFAKNSWDTLVQQVQKRIILGLLVFSLISVLFVLTGYVYVQVFLPEQYQPAKLYIIILGLGLPATALKNILQAMLESNFRITELLFVSIVPNVLRLAMFVVFWLLFGLLGIVWTMTSIAWLTLLFYYAAIIRHRDENIVMRVLRSFRP